MFSGLCTRKHKLSCLHNHDLIDRHMQYRCQHDQVVDCRHGGAVLPLVDCLRGGETENLLQVADGKACLLPQSCNVSSCCFHIN